MNTNATETTASILEEMRKGDKCDFPFAYRFAYCDAPAVVDVSTKDILEPAKIRIIKVTIDELADRLEKAIARETKNTAAMYEALEAFVQLADDGVIQPRIYGEAEHHCFCALLNQVAAALSTHQSATATDTRRGRMPRKHIYVRYPRLKPVGLQVGCPSRKKEQSL